MHWSQNLRRNKECALRKGYMQLVTVLDKSQRIYIPKELNANGHRIGVPSICALVHRIWGVPKHMCSQELQAIGRIFWGASICIPKWFNGMGYRLWGANNTQWAYLLPKSLIQSLQN